MNRKRTAARIPIVVLGEKDHGKSTLLGRLLYETRAFPNDRLSEIRKAAKKSTQRFEWAHLLDSFRYERENEMTLDTVPAIAEINGAVYEFIDVPGHRSLIKNMLSGATRARYAIALVDAAEGIKPQTIRHLNIARFLGVSHLIAVINKCDRIGYSREKFTRAEKLTAAALRKCAFPNAAVLPLVATTGDNLIRRSHHLAWFRGPTLFQAIEKNFHPAVSRREPRRGLLFAVQDVYADGMVVGRVTRGRVRCGAALSIVPDTRAYRVRAVFSGSRNVNTAGAGDLAGLTLVPPPRKIIRGDMLSDGTIALYSRIATRCIFIKKPSTRAITFESGFQESAAHVKLLEKRFILGTPLMAAIRLRKKCALNGEFVLKERGAIIALGKI